MQQVILGIDDQTPIFHMKKLVPKIFLFNFYSNCLVEKYLNRYVKVPYMFFFCRYIINSISFFDNKRIVRLNKERQKARVAPSYYFGQLYKKLGFNSKLRKRSKSFLINISSYRL